jgi:hypothetical protein
VSQIDKNQQKMDKKKITNLKGKKKAMIEALVVSMGNITASAKRVGIHRLTHYDWLNKDPEYKKEYESIDDMECDFYRNALHKLVQEGNVTAVIFGLKTKGKHRGYIEKQEIQHTGDLGFNIGVNIKQDSKKLYEE